MELLRNLFEGYPNLWGGGVAHSVLILSLVIAFGIMLGKIKVLIYISTLENHRKAGVGKSSNQSFLFI